jgi:hypothetical protein
MERMVISRVVALALISIPAAWAMQAWTLADRERYRTLSHEALVAYLESYQIMSFLGNYFLVLVTGGVIIALVEGVAWVILRVWNLRTRGSPSSAV